MFSILLGRKKTIIRRKKYSAQKIRYPVWHAIKNVHLITGRQAAVTNFSGKSLMIRATTLERKHFKIMALPLFSNLVKRVSSSLLL